MDREYLLQSAVEENEDILLHGRKWSEEAKRRVREARRAGRSVYDMFASFYSKLNNTSSKLSSQFNTRLSYLNSRRTGNRKVLIKNRSSQNDTKVSGNKKEPFDWTKLPQKAKPETATDKKKSKSSSGRSTSGSRKIIRTPTGGTRVINRSTEPITKNEQPGNTKEDNMKYIDYEYRKEIQNELNRRAREEIRKLEKSLGRSLKDEEISKIKNRYSGAGD